MPVERGHLPVDRRCGHVRDHDQSPPGLPGRAPRHHRPRRPSGTGRLPGATAGRHTRPPESHHSPYNTSGVSTGLRALTQDANHPLLHGICAGPAISSGLLEMLAVPPTETDCSGRCGASGTGSPRAPQRVPTHAWQDAARIDPNVISRDGSWCSFSLLAGLISKLPMRGPSMETHRALWHVKPTGRSLASARREPSTGTARARAAQGILVPALVLASLGAAAPASPGHGSAGHVHASAHQPADSLALSAGADSMTSCTTHSRPWMYSPGTSSRPWMYSPGTSSRDKVAFQPAPIPAGLGISRGHDLQRHDGCTFRWLRGAGCRAALLATTRRPVVTAPVGRQRSRCAMRP